jgi:hypothetical protein
MYQVHKEGPAGDLRDLNLTNKLPSLINNG